MHNVAPRHYGSNPGRPIFQQVGEFRDMLQEAPERATYLREQHGL